MDDKFERKIADSVSIKINIYENELMVGTRRIQDKSKGEKESLRQVTSGSEDFCFVEKRCKSCSNRRWLEKSLRCG